jgi:hypothetical protein
MLSEKLLCLPLYHLIDRGYSLVVVSLLQLPDGVLSPVTEAITIQYSLASVIIIIIIVLT